MFDLLSLHQTIDTGAKSWICAYGKDLRNYVMEGIRKSGFSFKKIIKNASKELRSSEGPFSEIFYFNKEWIPIPLLLYLIRINVINKKTSLKKIEYLKVNAAKAKPIKAVKTMSVTLCKILGSHAADGNLYTRIGFDSRVIKPLESILNIEQRKQIYKTNRGTYRYRVAYKEAIKILKQKLPRNIKIWQEYNIDLTDHYKNAVSTYSGWIKKLFGLDLLVKKYPKKDAWRINFSNKIIARYLANFFEFPIGEKTETVNEPSIIRKSKNMYRLAFLQGVMLFDGGVDKSGCISLVSKSGKLINSAKKILNNNGICPRLYFDVKRNRYSLNFRKFQSKNSLYLFEANTEKWQKLSDIHGL